MSVYKFGPSSAHSQRSSLVRKKSWAAAAKSPTLTTRHAAATVVPVNHPAVHKFLLDPSAAVRSALAEREITAEMLTFLSSDPMAAVRAKVAANENTHPETLERLTHDPDVRVQANAIVNPNITPAAGIEAIERMSPKGVESEHPKIVSNATNVDIFLHLAGAPNATVSILAGAASNRFMTKLIVTAPDGGAVDDLVKLFTSIAETSSAHRARLLVAGLLGNAAGNVFKTETPTRWSAICERLSKILIPLVRSNTPGVAAAVVGSSVYSLAPNVLPVWRELLKTDLVEVRKLLTINCVAWSIPKPVIARWGESPDAELRGRVAKHGPLELLSELTLHADPDLEVRVATAKRTPDVEVMKQLLNENNKMIHLALTLNDKLTPKIAACLELNHKMTVSLWSWRSIARLATSDDWDALSFDEAKIVALNPDATVAVACGKKIRNEEIMKLWLTRSANREALMSNPNATSGILHECFTRSRNIHDNDFLAKHPNLSLEDKVIIAMT
jgi:hypothetical protein